MGLKDIDFKLVYNTSENNLIEEFFKPALSKSIEYKRGVGYFTSGWLKYNSQGLAKFLKNGGKIKFITSPILDKNDIEALKGNYNEEIINEKLLEDINQLERTLESEYRNLLGWLVYDGIIQFKFAIPRYQLLGGEFHDKFGIFIDEENNILAFNGSINDSIKGFHNYESISVFPAWKNETCNLFAKQIEEKFDKLWENQDPNLLVYPLDKILKEKLIKFRENSNRPYDINIYNQKQIKPLIPQWLNLRNYQKEAIRTWISNEGKGILSMATGSGKTITTLTTITKLSNKIDKLAVLVVVPYKHLLEQWSEEGENFNINFLKCSSDYKEWDKLLNSKITSFLLSKSYFLPIITTNSTFVSKKFQSLIKRFNNLFLIVDEVHNWGAEKIRKNYLENAKYRLGLSATPERYFDEEGTQELLEYFGGIIFEYSLKDAIRDGNLCEYFYYPIFVFLTEQEQEEYIEISRKISSLFAQKENFEEEKIKNPSLELLLFKRARLLSSAENKLVKLKEVLIKENLINSKKNLFYVAANIEEDEYGNTIRDVDKVIELLTNLGMNVRKFTSEENKFEREYLIDCLKNEIIDGLVAIKCLDEGVDIPNVERAFILASSGNPREFIQRRGRILRKAENKKYAYIYDFIVLPKMDSLHEDETIYNINRTLLEKELKRFKEFSSLAKNKYKAEEKILDFKKKYKLLHI